MGFNDYANYMRMDNNNYHLSSEPNDNSSKSFLAQLITNKNNIGNNQHVNQQHVDSIQEFQMQHANSMNSLYRQNNNFMDLPPHLLNNHLHNLNTKN